MKQLLLRLKSRWLGRNGVKSAIFSVVVLILSYWVSNWEAPFGAEGWPIRLGAKLGWNLDIGMVDNEKDFMFVNTEYDKAIIPYYKSIYDTLGNVIYMDSIGNEPIVDRTKLITFLKAAKHAQNYKFIVVDLNLDMYPSDTIDSTLIKQNEELSELLFSMRDVYIARGSEDLPMIDSRLDGKSGKVSYVYGLKESGFIAEPLFIESLPAIPIRLTQDFDHLCFSNFGNLLYFSNGKLCRNKVSPRGFLQVEAEPFTTDMDKTPHCCYFTLLGTDYVDSKVADEEFDNKMIFLGAYEREDMHVTPLGKFSGTAILASVYVSLQQQRHVVNWLWVFALFVCYCIYINYLLLSNPFKVKPVAANGNRIYLGKVWFVTKKILVLLFYIMVTTILFVGLKLIATYWVNTDYFFATPMFVLGVIGNIVKTWKKI